MLYRGLGDAVAAVHAAYLAFIPLGGFLAWRWPGLIRAHLAAVAVGLISVTVGFDCPLTTWELALRRRAGAAAYHGGFVNHYLAGRLYPRGYESAVQLTIAASVVAAYAYLLARPRHR